MQHFKKAYKNACFRGGSGEKLHNYNLWKVIPASEFLESVKFCDKINLSFKSLSSFKSKDYKLNYFSKAHKLDLISL